MSEKYIRIHDAVDALAKTMPTPATPDGAGEFDHEIHIADEAFADAIRIIESLEPADVVPVRHARWEHVKHKSVEHGEIVIDGETVRCSDCRHAEKGWNAGMDFCPNCGADMRGEQE